MCEDSIDVLWVDLIGFASLNVLKDSNEVFALTVGARRGLQIFIGITA